MFPDKTAFAMYRRIKTVKDPKLQHVIDRLGKWEMKVPASKMQLARKRI